MPAPSTHRVEVAEVVWQMLDRHAEFLAQASPQGARQLVDRIVGDIASLDFMPERYAFYDSPLVEEKRYRKMVSARRYLIIYEIVGEVVYVDGILDCRQENLPMRHTPRSDR